MQLGSRTLSEPNVVGRGLVLAEAQLHLSDASLVDGFQSDVKELRIWLPQNVP